MSHRHMDRVKVLVVDDNLHMTKVIRAMLRGFGIDKVFTTRDVEEAIKVIQEERPDLLITDYHMRPVDGAEFVHRVRTSRESANPYIPVIMLTAYSERRVVESSRDSGITEFCAKPVTPSELFRKIASVVNAPRSFVRTSVYFGPDRRRRKVAEYGGSERRDQMDSGDCLTI